MKKNIPFFLLALLAVPAYATWTVTSTLPVGDNFTATDGTWDLRFSRSSSGGYTCRNNSGTGGATLDLTTFNDDMADAGVLWNNNYPVTVIGLYNEGFMNLSGLTEVRLPSTVKTLSNQCFRGTGLAGEFVIPESVTSMGDNVFSGCKSLTRVVVNENLKILQNTFFGCTSLQEVKIASGTTTLSGSPFRECPALVSVYADEADRAVGTVTLPATVTSLSSYAFYKDASIERIVAPGVTSIGERAFQDCTSLTDVVLPALQQFSSTYTFCGCPLLQRVELPSCTRLGQATFQSCTALEEVLVSPALSYLGSDCFRGCTSFKTLYTNEATKVEGHVQVSANFTGTIGGYTFYHTKITRIDAPGATGIGGERSFEGCTLLEEVHLPSLASMSGTYVFSGCPLLTKVEVSPNLAGTIGDCDFSSCYSLESVYQSGNAPVVGLVDLPAGVTTIKWGCFWHCGAIEHVVAPGVTVIHNRGFRDCRLLKTVRFSPELSLLDNNNGSSSDCAINDCPSLVDFYPSTMPNITALKAGTFVNDSSLTNSFDFSGATLTDTSGSFFLSGAANVPCVRLPASFTRLYDREFYNMKPGAEIHFAGGVPPFNNNYPLWQGKNGAGYRYKIFVDAETYPAWTNNTVSGASFTPKTAAMESESDYLGIATLGYLNYASSGQNNWLVQEPFYVDVTFFDEDGTTVLGVEKTLLGTAPAWTGETPAKPSTAQYSYTFAGWSTDGSSIVDLSSVKADAPMSFQAVYMPDLRSHTITWQWFDGTANQSETTIVAYGETPVHAAVERIPAGGCTYTFSGWSTDGTTVLRPLPAVSGPATYIAVFEAKEASTTVTVRWLDDDGTTVLGTTWPDAGTAAVAPLVPEKESTVSTVYAFAGWSADGETVLSDLTVSADADFIAVYASSVREYTVAFVDWDETSIKTVQLGYGTAAEDVEAVRPADPTRAANDEYTYAFTGWAPAFAAVAGDATYTATYAATPKTYAATFVDGTDGSTILGPTNYAYGAVVEAPVVPEHYGYTFAAWSPEVSTMPAADMTYTAVYATNQYTIRFVNGNETTAAKYPYLTPETGISFPSGTKNATKKECYTFRGWSPVPEAVQSNTTYTATFERKILSPMKLALQSMEYSKDSGEIAIVAAVVNGESGATTEVGVANNRAATVDAGVSGSVVTAALSGLELGRGYEWTVYATQTVYGVTEVAKLCGRTWARKEEDWFVPENVSWCDGAYAPDSVSPPGQQVRLDATVTFPAILPRVLPDAAATQGVVVGITAYQPNAGVEAAYYCWNGSAWVKLVGTSPAGGAAVRVLGVVDFARKSGPAVAWYADGIQLTTESGGWEVPLAGGTKLTSAAKEGNFEVSSFSADYDTGGMGFTLFMR